MIAPDGYRLKKPARVTPTSELRRAVCEADRRSVLLKACSEGPRLVRERRMIDRLDGRNIPVALDLDASIQPPVLVLSERTSADLRDFVSLEEFVGARALDVRVFLDIGLQLSELIGDVHDAHLIHRELNPAIVFIRPSDLKLLCVDFALAGEVGESLTGRPDGSQIYCAPEQTGHLDSGEDPRTDLYLLGLTLYFCLLGRPPFEAASGDDLAVQHLSAEVPRPDRIRGDVPEMISRLLLRLLEKEPTSRYQTARAVHHDLRMIRERLGARGSEIEPFELGQTESMGRPLFDRHLYGREAEVEVLEQAFSRARTGGRELCLLSGPHGIGKAAVIRELRPHVLSHDGHLCQGKFDRYRRDVPYHGFRGAFDGLVQQILMQSDAGLARWRETIQRSLGNLSGAMIELLPDLKLVLGPQPPPPPVGAREAAERLLLTIQRFVSAIASRERPLVIALYNLQWADAGSRRVIEELVQNEQVDGLLLIGTYREEPARTQTALAATVRRLQERGAKVRSIELQPLSDPACQRMIAESLSLRITEVHELAGHVSRKTGNNPLVIQQFLTLLHERGILVHRAQSGWTWDIEELAAADIPDGAVGMMTAKLRALGERARDVLNLASCLGSAFTAEQLARSSAHEPEAIQEELRGLVQSGLIAPCREGLRFVHDGIREAALELIPAPDLARRHYAIAGQLMGDTHALEGRSPFEVADHICAGQPAFRPDESYAAAAFALQAAIAANEAGACAAAERYLETTRALIEHSGEVLDRETEIRLIVTSADAALQAGHFESALRYLAEVDAETLQPMQFAQIAGKRCQIFTLSQGPEKGARYLLSALRHLGVRWPLRPSRLRMRFEHLRTELALRGTRYGERLEPTTLVGPVWACPLLLGLGGSALRIDIHLLFLATSLSLRLFARHGFVGPPAYTLAAHAAYGFAIFPNPERAAAYGSAARHWLAAFPERPVYRHRAEFLVRTGVDCWLSPRRESVEPLRQVRESAFESGDIEFGLHAASYACVIRALTGDPVSEVSRELKALSDKVRRLGHRYPEVKAIHGAYQLLAPNDRSEAAQPPALEAEFEDSRHLYAGDRNAEVRVSTIWMLVLAIYERFDLVWRETRAIGSKLARVSPAVHSPDHTLLAGLAAAVLARRASGSEAWALRRSAKRLRTRLESWSRYSPDCGPMTLLLGAEIESLQRPGEQALQAFDRAEAALREVGYVHYAALAQERAGAMLGSTPSHKRSAGVSFGRASALYTEWGAELKAQLLRRRSQR